MKRITKITTEQEQELAARYIATLAICYAFNDIADSWIIEAHAAMKRMGKRPEMPLQECVHYVWRAYIASQKSQSAMRWSLQKDEGWEHVADFAGRMADAVEVDIQKLRYSIANYLLKERVWQANHLAYVATAKIMTEVAVETQTANLRALRSAGFSPDLLRQLSATTSKAGALRYLTHACEAALNDGGDVVEVMTIDNNCHLAYEIIKNKMFNQSTLRANLTAAGLVIFPDENE